jgi:hypothetical protein
LTLQAQNTFHGKAIQLEGLYSLNKHFRRNKMKTLSLLSALLLTVSINAYANQSNGEQAATNQMAEKIHLAATSADEVVHNATRLKFISRRAAHNPAVNNKDAYNADENWVGATYVDEQEANTSKRLNRQFTSKRPNMNYQFD